MLPASNNFWLRQMTMSERRRIKFVRALISGAIARREVSGLFRIIGSAGSPSLDASEVRTLSSDGILLMEKDQCKASALAKNWLRRKISSTGDPADQHRHIVQQRDGTVLNFNESPLARLAVGSANAKPFLQHHHVLAGERLRALVERAQMMERTTMSYDPNRLPSKGKTGKRGMDLNDAAIDARTELHAILSALPPDCASAVMDVCGFLKGLQLVERERQWPRRSAKLVLRVGLEQLARHFGFSQVATGAPCGRLRVWLDEEARPDKFE